jgi:hypothetical protein
LLDRLGLLEHTKHLMGDVGAGSEQAATEDLPVSRPAGADQQP